MTDENENKDEEASSFLNLSDDKDALDEAFNKAMEEAEAAENSDSDSDDSSDGTKNTDDSENTDDSDNDSDELDEQNTADNTDEDKASDDTDSNEDDTESSDDTTEDDSNEDDSDNADDNTESDKTGSINYEAEYKRLTKPFKANGKQIQVGNVDDAISLMQMGANYVKKMKNLKPSLKIIKMLEKNDLLDENKINYLIDLNNKNPGAVSKLVKDSKIDPLDLDDEKKTEYKPTNHIVTDSEVELDNVLDSISDTDTYEATTNLIGNKWDDASKAEILRNPNIIRTINAHMSNGIYEQVSTVVENERVLGRIPDNVSDVEAYGRTAKAMDDQGLFKNNSDNFSESKDESVAKNKDEQKRIKRRKAAGATKKSGTPKPQKIDILNLSDEDFAKLDTTSLFKTV